MKRETSCVGARGGVSLGGSDGGIESGGSFVENGVEPGPSPDRRKIGRRSKRKGKRGELDAVRAWKEATGLPARRSRQYAGRPESPDLEIGIPGIYAECRRREKMNVGAAVERAAREAGDMLPILLHRANRQPWLLTLRLADLRKFVELLIGAFSLVEKERGVGG